VRKRPLGVETGLALGILHIQNAGYGADRVAPARAPHQAQSGC
jgi:hypothetical protein